MTIARTRKMLAAKGAAPVLGAALLFGTAACSDSEGPNEAATIEDIQDEDTGGVLDDDGASEDEIAEAPNPEGSDEFFQEGDTEGFFGDSENFVNLPVVVSGKIVEVFSPNAFVIGEGDLATLVTRPTDDSMVTLEPGQIAQVSGTVGTFVLVDVEEELGLDFEDDDFSPFETAPYIPADNVNLLDEE